MIAAVNHSGDSDSTGAITGNILGAYLGLSGIPEKYIDNLELVDVLTELADDLYDNCQLEEYKQVTNPRDRAWEQKYVYINYQTAKENRGKEFICNARHDNGV